MPSPNPGTLRLPRTFALSTADPRTAGSATGTPHAPLSSHESRCWGPAGTLSSLTPLFQKLCLRWTNQGTTENHSLAYRVTGIEIKSGLLRAPNVWNWKRPKISWHVLIVTVIHWSSSHVRSYSLVVRTAHRYLYYSPENSVLVTEIGQRRNLGLYSQEEKLTHFKKHNNLKERTKKA